VVAGQRINKVDLQRFVAIDRKMMRQQHEKDDKSDVIVTSSATTGGCHAQNSHGVSPVQVTGEADQCGFNGHDSCSSPEVHHNNVTSS